MEYQQVKKVLPVVSIIVPVYNAESTLSLTLSTLLVQTYERLELLFVNDYSIDRSLEIIQEAKGCFEQRGMNVKIITHEVNLGVAAARNTGLEHATGDYIYYVDADDWIGKHTIQLVMEEALRTEAEIIGFDWYLSFEKEERLMRQPNFSKPAEAIDFLLEGKMRWNLWIFVVKRSLYENHNIRFIPQMNMGEDMMVMFKLFSFAQNVCHLPYALYHYGQSNGSSLTKTYSDKHIREVTVNIKEVERHLSVGDYAERIGQKLSFLKLNIKLPLLISNQHDRYQKWYNWFPESNQYVWKNKTQSLRIRLIQWAASKRMYFLVKCHYYLVIRVVYGFIYR